MAVLPDQININQDPVVASDGKQTYNQEPFIGNKEAVTINKLSIIIPAYNEERTIALILDRINEVKLIRNIEKEVIIVNDCSTDNTEEVLRHYMENTPNLTINYFKYVKHDINQGKGAAIHLMCGKDQIYTLKILLYSDPIK